MATKTSRELTWQAIEKLAEKAWDAHTVEDALRYHNEILDLFAIEIMIVRLSDKSPRERQALLLETRARAEYHRDVVDRLTDIIERDGNLISFVAYE